MSNEKPSPLSELATGLAEGTCSQPRVGLAIVIIVGEGPSGQVESVMSARMSTDIGQKAQAQCWEFSKTINQAVRSASSAMSDAGPAVVTRDDVCAPDSLRPAAKA